MLWTRRCRRCRRRHRNICLILSFISWCCKTVFISSFGWIFFHFKMLKSFVCSHHIIWQKLYFTVTFSIITVWDFGHPALSPTKPSHSYFESSVSANIQHLPTVKQTQTPPAWTAAGDASPCSFGATLTRTCSRWTSAPCCATPSSPTEAAQQNEH